MSHIAEDDNKCEKVRERVKESERWKQERLQRQGDKKLRQAKESKHDENENVRTT